MHSIDTEGCPDAELDFAIGLLLSERKRRETERARVAKPDLFRKGERDPRHPRCGARLQAAAPASARIVLQSLLTAANRLFPDQVSFASSQKSFASSSSNFLAAAFGHSPKMAPTNASTPSVDCARIFAEVPPCNLDDSIMELPFLIATYTFETQSIGDAPSTIQVWSVLQ